MAARQQGLVIVGGGPAGLAPLFAAASVGRLAEVLERGVTILERSDTLGSGDLGNYAIGSDSSAETFLDIVTRSKEPRLLALRWHPLTRKIAALGKESVPLALIGDFLQAVGRTLCEVVVASKGGAVLKRATAQRTQQMASGAWRTTFLDAHNCRYEIDSQNVLLATGGHQPWERLGTEEVAGAPLLPAYKGKLLQSGYLLTPQGLAAATDWLQGKQDPRIVIVGGSTSAAAVAHALLTRLRGVSFGQGGITLLHRRPVRIFYETASEALADGYDDFCADDTCPVTGRINRLSGFRLDSKDLMLRVCGLGGRSRETRVQLHRLTPEQHGAAQGQLREADLIVAALGYRPRLLPVFDSAMESIGLQVPTAERWAAVDDGCRVLRGDSQPLPGLFALGLAVGPGANRQLGGERGFTGQVNGLWMWQHTLGLRILDQVSERSRRALAASAPSWSAMGAIPGPAFAGTGRTELAGAA